MGNYCLRQVGEGKELSYKASEEERIFPEYYRPFENSRQIVGFAPLTVEKLDTCTKVTYSLGRCISLQNYLEKPMDEEQMLLILHHITSALLQLEEQELPLHNVIWNLNCIFINEETSKLQFIYHIFYEPPESIPLNQYITGIINKMQIIKVNHNVKQFLKSYLMFQPKLIIRDFEVFLHNMLSKLYENPECSSSMALSCSLEEEQIVVEECNRLGVERTSLLQMEEEKESTVYKASLIRLRNREIIPITKNEFRLGKERCTVDYCIIGNAAISRCHALITESGGKYFIRDLESTNHTYVNNQKVQGRDGIEMHDGAKITLANEVFRFQIEEENRMVQKKAEIPF